MMPPMRGKRGASQGNPRRDDAPKVCTQAKTRLASCLAIVGLDILTAVAFIPRSAAAIDNQPDLNPTIYAAFKVFVSIIGNEVMIERCRVFDAANASAYDEVYRKYRDTVSLPILRINKLIN